MAGSGAEYPIARITIDYVGVRQAVDESKRALSELSSSARTAMSEVQAGSQSIGSLGTDSASAAQALAGLRSTLDGVSSGMSNTARVAREELATGLKDTAAAAQSIQGALGTASQGAESALSGDAFGGVVAGMEAAGEAATAMEATVGDSMDEVATGMADAGGVAAGALAGGMDAASLATAALGKAGAATAASVGQLDAVAAGMGKAGRAALTDIAAGMSETQGAAASLNAGGVEALDAVATGMSAAGEQSAAMATEITAGGAAAATAAESLVEHGAASAVAADGTSALVGQLANSVAKFATVDAVIHGAVEVFHDWVGAIEDAEQAGARLNAMITATGDASGVTAHQVKEFADTMETKTLFKAEDIEQAVAELMTFTSVHGDVFKRAEHDALELGQQMGSAEAGARGLGFALENPEVGLTRLRRAGVAFTEMETERIKVLQKSGDLEGAQVAVLAAVEAHLKAIAEAAHDAGLVGELHDMAVAWKNMLDSHADDALVTRGIWVLTEALKGLSSLSPADALKAHLGGMADELDAIARHAESVGMASLDHPQNHVEELLAFEEKKQADNGGQLTDPDQAHRITVLREVLDIEQQLARAANATHVADVAAEDAADKRAKKERDALEAARQLAEQQKADAERRKKENEGLEYLSSLEEENLAVKNHPTDPVAAEAQKAYDKVLDAHLPEYMAEEARQLVLSTGALKENLHATEELARKKAEAAQRVQEYVQRLHEEADALKAGDKGLPAGHEEAVRAAGGDPAALQEIAGGEARVAFYKELDVARQDDTKREEEAAQADAKLWEKTDKEIGESFDKTFQAAIDGKVKSFGEFCRAILEDWSKTMTHMSAQMLEAKLTPDGKGGSTVHSVAGSIAEHFFPHAPDTFTAKQTEDIRDAAYKAQVAGEEAIPESVGGFAKPTAAETAADRGGLGARLGPLSAKTEADVDTFVPSDRAVRDVGTTTPAGRATQLSQDDVVRGVTTHLNATPAEAEQRDAQSYIDRMAGGNTPLVQDYGGPSGRPAFRAPHHAAAAIAAAEEERRRVAWIHAQHKGDPARPADATVRAAEGGHLVVPFGAQSGMQVGGGPRVSGLAGGVVSPDFTMPAASADGPPVPQHSSDATEAAVARTAMASAPAPSADTGPMPAVPYAAAFGQVAPSAEANAPPVAPTAARDAAIAASAATALTGEPGATQTPSAPPVSPLTGGENSRIQRILDDEHKRQQEQRSDGGQPTPADAAFGSVTSLAGSSTSSVGGDVHVEGIRPPAPSQNQTSPIASAITAITPFLQMAAGHMGGGAPSVPQESPSDMAAQAGSTTLEGPAAPGVDLTQTAAPAVEMAPVVAPGADAASATMAPVADAGAGASADAASAAIGAASDAGSVAATDAASAAAAGAAAAGSADVIDSIMAMAPMFHEGGVVGDHASHPTREVPASLFDSAPRFHSGLGGDEFPAILQRGERVLTEQHQQQVVAGARGGAAGTDGDGEGGHTHVHFHIHAIDGRDAERFVRENQHHIVRMVADGTRRNASLARHLSGR
jgi:hypothetical protein